MEHRIYFEKHLSFSIQWKSVCCNVVWFPTFFTISLLRSERNAHWNNM